MLKTQRRNLDEVVDHHDSDHDTNIGPDPKVWTIAFLGILIGALVMPFIVSRRRRQSCYRCLVRRGRGSSSNNDDQQQEGGNAVINNNRTPFVRRYPPGDPRHKFTREEAEEETESFILDKLKQYSKVIDTNDFVLASNDDNALVVYVDIEEGQDTSTPSTVQISATSSQASTNQSSNIKPFNASIPNRIISFVSSSIHTKEDDDNNGTSLRNERNLKVDEDGLELVKVVGLEGQKENHGDHYDFDNLDQKTSTSSSPSSILVHDTAAGRSAPGDTRGVRLKLPSPGVCISECENVTPTTAARNKNNSMNNNNENSHKEKRRKTKMKNEEDVKDEKYNLIKVVASSEENGSPYHTYRSNECSICLSPFSEGEIVSWSGLQDCPHVFHQECILHWLATKGHQSLDNWNDNNIMQAHIGRFEMKCPNCRQDFIRKK